MARALRILYAAGPGDVIGTFRHWSDGRDDPSQVAVTYSGQFYSLCKQIGAKGYVIAYHPRKERIESGPFIIEHRPLRFAKGPGALYHLEQIWYGLRLTMSAIRFGADAAVVSDGAHWFSLGLMCWFGIKVIPTLHCVLWLKHRPPRGKVGRIVRWLNKGFFRRGTAGVLCLSNDIRAQVEELLGVRAKPIEPFLPTYRAASFAGLEKAPDPPPFRVFFAGRIEQNKGVFDLLAITRRFAAEGRREIAFDLCGEGSKLEQLRREAKEAGVEERFRCHGHVEKPRMRQMYAAAHVVIAPTTSDFVEGFNKVVAEGVLAGKPVITSSVCPALEYVRDAVVEVAPNDVEGYGNAILRLSGDAGWYDDRRRGCEAAQEQFYDPSRSWGAALQRMLNRVIPHATPVAAADNPPGTVSTSNQIGAVANQQPGGGGQ